MFAKSLFFSSVLLGSFFFLVFYVFSSADVNIINKEVLVELYFAFLLGYEGIQARSFRYPGRIRRADRRWRCYRDVSRRTRQLSTKRPRLIFGPKMPKGSFAYKANIGENVQKSFCSRPRNTSYIINNYC